jgi:hypothetical protein
MTVKTKKNYSMIDFIDTLLDLYHIPLLDIYFCAKEGSDDFNNIMDIYKFSTPMQQELCLTLLAMISLKNNRSIVREFKEENGLLDEYDTDVIKKAIDKNKTLLVSALMYNNNFANSALLLCAYMGRKVLDRIEEFKKAVSQNGFQLEKVPEEYQLDDPVIVVTAVSQSGRVLRHVQNKTFEVCLAAVKKYAWALEYITDILDGFSTEQIYEICSAAVTSRGLTIKYVFPNKNIHFAFSEEQTKSLCMLAVKNNGLALDYVPWELRKDKKLCLEAVKQSCRAMSFVPSKEIWIDEIYDAFLVQSQKEIEEIQPFYIGEDFEYCENDDQKKTSIYFYPYGKEELQEKLVICDSVGKNNNLQFYRSGFMANAGSFSLVLPEKAIEIEKYAFANTNIPKIYFTGPVSIIHRDSFVENIGSLMEPYKNISPGKGKAFLCENNIVTIVDIPKEVKEIYEKKRETA